MTFLFFTFLLFSDARPDQTRRPIWARSTSKDAASCKEESFWDSKNKGNKFNGVLPLNPNIAPQNRVSHVKFKVELRENG